MVARIEQVCVGILFVYLLWVPLPFGSIVPRAFAPLVLPPLLVCAAVALLRVRRAGRYGAPAPFRIWFCGGVAWIVIIALQLVPLPRPVLGLLSPAAAQVWHRADLVASLAGLKVATAHPLSIDPEATRRELVRIVALAATFLAAAFLVYDRKRRLLFAWALSAAALFEALYGVQEATMRRYEIWGWPNRLIFDRVTGTFVNPNHFAHYLAISLPFAIYIGVAAWNGKGKSAKPFLQHASALAEKQVLLIGAAVLLSLSCIAGILLSQSRGALLACAAGFGMSMVISVMGSTTEETRHSRRRRAAKLAIAGSAAAAVFVLLAVAMAVFLGRERTIDRFRGLEQDPEAAVGRRAEIGAALRIWKSFPVFGSGAGTFESIIGTVQRENLGATYQHAHDDYAEIGATTGILGFVAAVGAFVFGLVVFARGLVVQRRRLSWSSRAFALAALTSIFIASVHALFDFNFFMPSNAATIAAIGGVAVALRFREAAGSPEGGAAARPV